MNDDENKIRKYATDRACEPGCCAGSGRKGQSDESIAREEKGGLRGIIRYSCLKKAGRRCGRESTDRCYRWA